MLFQIIDNKQICPSIYADKKIINDPEYNSLTKTWSYNSSLKDYDIDYASLYVNGKSLDQCCPDILKDKWEKVKQKHLAFLKSFETGKVNFNDYCFYDLVPENFVMEYFEVKSQITDHIFNTYERPDNYDFMVELSEMVGKISENRLILNISGLDDTLHQLRTRNFKKKIQKIPPYIQYNVFGTITGRLTTKKDSFPILTMDKNYRKIIQPKNDWFIELDFNAAELRCLLALNGVTQPEMDIH